MPETVTSSIRVLIVDDEPLARDCMRLALSGSPGVTIVAECSDGIGAVDAIRAHGPDIVFLDVQMPGLDGFGVIERIGTGAMPAVVFVTAYDVHAIRAFEVHALDYVLKPFDDDRFLAALERARGVVLERQHGALGRRLAAVMQEWQGPGGRFDEERGPASLAPGGASHLATREGDGAFADDDLVPDRHEEPERRRNGRTSYIARFAVRENGRVRFVAAATIDWIEADGNYMVLHVGDAKHRVRASLSHVIDELDPRLFVRIHRSAIVNIDRIREVQPWFGGDYVAILRSGEKLKVSRMRASQLLRPMA